MQTDSIHVQYFTNHFPAEAVFKFYEPSAGSVKGREWCVGSYYKRFAAHDASVLRRELVEYCKGSSDNDIRYDVGPVFEKPYTLACLDRRSGINPNTHARVVYTEFRIDIDVTDYEQVRRACGCGGDKSKVCEKCWLVMRATCDTVNTALEYYFLDDESSITWVFTGGRGLHAWVRGSMGGCLDRTIRSDLTSALTQACQFDMWEKRLRESNIPVPKTICLDSKVTTDLTHPTRGIFSPHSAHSLLATPLNVQQVCQHEYGTLVHTLVPSLPALIKEASPGPNQKLLEDAIRRLPRVSPSK